MSHVIVFLLFCRRQAEELSRLFIQLDADGSGSVLFDEFCMFAVANDLDIEDDNEFRMTPEDLELLRNSKILIDEQANRHKGPLKDNKLNDVLSKKSKKYD